MSDRFSGTPVFLVERLIREAADRGEFDGLPGTGRPISDLDVPYEPGWWAKRWLERNRLLDEAREVRMLALREARRLRSAGRLEEAQSVLGTAERRLGRINAGLPTSERVPIPGGRVSG